MATVIRPEVSQKNRYWIDKHRHYELKHFCLQYPTWRSMYVALGDDSTPMSMIEHYATTNLPSDPTARRAIMRAQYAEKMDIIEKAAVKTDKYLSSYILRAVTENLSYTYLKTKLDIPCSRDMYYDRYRRFFWILSESRN